MTETRTRPICYRDVCLTASLDQGAAGPRLVAADQAGSQVSGLLDQILLQSPPLVRGYTRYLAVSYGKFLRAQSLLTCARAADGLLPYNAVIAAAAVELVHLATLVHDDVIDEADMRRGRPSLRKLAGNKSAVICGDYILSQGVRLASSLQEPERFLDRQFRGYLSEVCLGELNQHLNNNNFDLTPLTYFKIINGKTAALFELSFLAGAVTGGEPESVWNLYRLLGHAMGMIFQLSDDCLDFESDIRATGKNVQSDYEQQVFTLPLIYAFTSDPAFKAAAVDAHRRGEKLDRAVINAAVDKNQGLLRTHRVAQRYGAKANLLLGQLPVDPVKKQLLEQLIAKALRPA
jgi:heptaprenyl diphosphate synthase